MADIIQLLPDSIANQIAAGEVVQRPASIVKELLENSVDAGATNIKLIIKDAGKTLVQVIDNGCGMSETDARMCFERHATSKIRTADDLFAIRTMGFRGEAMASIAAVAHVEMKTRRTIDELGTKILIEGSTLKSHEPIQTPVGTSILVKNLFYNVPARRNFLKSNTIEMRHILDEFQRVALANPSIFFSLHHNNLELYHLLNGNLRQRIVGLLGNACNPKLVPVAEDADIIRIHGFVGKPEYAKKTRGEQFFFVNNRFIKSSYLHHAVVGAYEDLIGSDTFPLYVVFLDIDPARIDVNVHPTKQEIKFEDERLIYNYLKVATRHALGQHSITPTLDFEQDNSFSPFFSPSPRQSDANITNPSASSKSRNEPRPSPSGDDNSRQMNNLRNWQLLYEGLENERNVPDEEQETAIAITIESGLQLDDVEGSFTKPQKEPYQIHSTYIVNQIKSGFLLIDQQSAHERILYEKYMYIFENKQIVTQGELFPKTINLPPADAVLLREILPDINQLGFEVENFGQNSFIIRGIPAELKETRDEQAILDTLIEQYKKNIDLKLNMRDNIACAMAVGAATKRGRTLAVKEMQMLVDQLFACAMPYKSPTGRRCFITIELDELQKRFLT